jgi:hypothetical protein
MLACVAAGRGMKVSSGAKPMVAEKSLANTIGTIFWHNNFIMVK